MVRGGAGVRRCALPHIFFTIGRHDLLMSSDGAAAVPGLRIRFWGVRGSVCASGREFVEFGGHTPCLEVRCGERLFIVDAGTGITMPRGTSTSCSAISTSTM